MPMEREQTTIRLISEMEGRIICLEDMVRFLKRTVLIYSFVLGGIVVMLIKILAKL